MKIQLAALTISLLLSVSDGAHADQRADSLYTVALETSATATLKTSIKAFNHVLAADSKHAAAYNALAKLYLLENTPGARKQAERAASRAIGIDRDNLDYQLTRGDVYWSQGFFTKAKNHYERVLEKNPEAVTASYKAGFIALGHYMFERDRLSNHHGPATLAHQKVFASEEMRRVEIFLGKCIDLDTGFLDAYYQLGLAYYESNRYADMITLMASLMREHPDNSDALLFTALALQAEGKLQSAQKYYTRALASMGPEQRAVLESLDLVASEDQKSEIMRAEGSGITLGSRGKWEGSETRDRFWKQSDPLFLTDYNERRMEHYARVAYATLRFSTPSGGIEGWKTARGRTYIKFGRYRYRRSGFQTFAYETWYYEDYRFGFISPDGFSGWGFDTEVGLGGPSIAAGIAWCKLRDTAHLSPTDQMEVMFAAPPPGVPGWVNDPAMYQPRGEEALQTFAPRYVDPFAPSKYSVPHLVTAFREQDRIRLELAYAVPVSRMKASDYGHVTFDDGLFLFDETWNDLHRKIDVVSAPSDHGYITRHRTVQLDPGDVQVAVEIGDHLGGSIGTFRENRTLHVPDSLLAMSDLLLARRIAPHSAFPEARTDLDITPNPLRSFRQDDPVFVYFELYNLERDTFGRTHYRISYRFTRPEREEADPRLFAAMDLLAGPDGIEVQASEQEDGTTEYFVRYLLPERNKVSDKALLANTEGTVQTTVQAEYEGSSKDDFTYLQIDVSRIPVGLHKLIVEVTDTQSGNTDTRNTLFKIVRDETP